MKFKIILNILNNNISILEYIILDAIKENTADDFVKTLKFNDTFIKLKKLEYISNNNKLTIKGKEIIDKINKINNIDNFYEQLHKSLQDELLNLTGKKQKMLQGKYGFIPTVNDLKLKLQKVIKNYNLKDEEKIKEVLISYVKRCVKVKFDYVQTINYYILKDGISNFATDYENYIETKQEEQDEFTGINI